MAIPKNHKEMILKLQRPIVTNGPAEIMIYNEERDFMTTLPYTQEVEDQIFQGELKVYARAYVPQYDGDYIKIEELLEEQDW